MTVSVSLIVGVGVEVEVEVEVEAEAHLFFDRQTLTKLPVENYYLLSTMHTWGTKSITITITV